jgi:hypothetical protein
VYHLVQQGIAQGLGTEFEVFGRELDQRRLVRDAAGEVREARVESDAVSRNLTAEVKHIELREEELQLGLVG